jgi:hypothetical protein
LRADFVAGPILVSPLIHHGRRWIGQQTLEALLEAQTVAHGPSARRVFEAGLLEESMLGRSVWVSERAVGVGTTEDVPSAYGPSPVDVVDEGRPDEELLPAEDHVGSPPLSFEVEIPILCEAVPTDIGVQPSAFESRGRGTCAKPGMLRESTRIEESQGQSERMRRYPNSLNLDTDGLNPRLDLHLDDLGIALALEDADIAVAFEPSRLDHAGLLCTAI